MDAPREETQVASGLLPASGRQLLLLDCVDTRHVADRLLVWLDRPDCIVVQVEPSFECCLLRLEPIAQACG